MDTLLGLGGISSRKHDNRLDAKKMFYSIMGMGFGSQRFDRIWKISKCLPYRKQDNCIFCSCQNKPWQSVRWQICCRLAIRVWGIQQLLGLLRSWKESSSKRLHKSSLRASSPSHHMGIIEYIGYFRITSRRRLSFWNHWKLQCKSRFNGRSRLYKRENENTQHRQRHNANVVRKE